MEATTLHDRLGGADGIETVVDEFYDRMPDGEHMRAAHRYLDLTRDDFETVLTHLRASLDACGVDEADADEVIAAVRGLEDDVLRR